MAHNKHGKRLTGGYRESDAVLATETFHGRRTPPPALTDTRSATIMIPQGSIGLIHGNAAVVPEYLDVEFELGPGLYVRVETLPEYIIPA
jgi:hypothetical protein